MDSHTHINGDYSLMLVCLIITALGNFIDINTADKVVTFCLHITQWIAAFLIIYWGYYKHKNKK